MSTETDLGQLQRMRAEYEGWRGKVLDDAIVELAALRALVRHGIHCKHPSCQMAGRCSYAPDAAPIVERRETGNRP
jgi:hypothetical protein